MLFENDPEWRDSIQELGEKLLLDHAAIQRYNQSSKLVMSDESLRMRATAINRLQEAAEPFSAEIASEAASVFDDYYAEQDLTQVEP